MGLALATVDDGLQDMLQLRLRLRASDHLHLLPLRSIQLTLPLPLLLHDEVPAKRSHLTILRLLLRMLDWD